MTIGYGRVRISAKQRRPEAAKAMDGVHLRYRRIRQSGRVGAWPRQSSAGLPAGTCCLTCLLRSCSPAVLRLRARFRLLPPLLCVRACVGLCVHVRSYPSRGRKEGRKEGWMEGSTRPMQRERREERSFFPSQSKVREFARREGYIYMYSKFIKGTLFAFRR